jgi:ribonuclease Z
MPQVILLGTARALPNPSQENTFMAVLAGDSAILIDCAGSPYARLLQAGIDPGRLEAVVITHAHPDHTYGLPVLFMDLWLAGRRRPLAVYGPEQACDLVRAMLTLYRSDAWPNMYAVEYHPVPLVAGARVLETRELEITAVPMDHMLPAIGLRVLDKGSGRALAYSGDTQPGPGIRTLANGAHMLIHEATGEDLGHSSAGQAGAIAQEAGVERLVLVHYDGAVNPPDALEQEARSQFAGDVRAGRDFDRMTW